MYFQTQAVAGPVHEPVAQSVAVQHCPCRLINGGHRHARCQHRDGGLLRLGDGAVHPDRLIRWRP